MTPMHMIGAVQPIGCGGHWRLGIFRMVMLAASIVSLCAAQSLPNTVVSGYTECANIPECNVPGDGTVLEVATMTANAKTAGNATATFKTEGTQFSGKLVVDCLTTDPWSNGVSLTVEIRDGARVVGTVIPTVLQIKGALRLGSSILIINGTYDFVAVFLVVTYFGLEDSSSVVVTGLQFVYTTMPDSVMHSSEPLVVNKGSRIEISHTNHSLTSLTRGNAWAWYVFNSVSSITISANSTVALVGNSYTMKSLTSPVCDMGMMSITSQPLTISTNGSLLIADNMIDLKSHTAASGAFSVKMLTQTLATELSSGATLRVSNNRAAMNIVTASLIATLVTVDTLALNGDASNVEVSGNVYDVNALSAAGIVVAFLRPTNWLTTNGTLVEVSDNAFIRNSVVVSSPTQSSIALVGGVSNVGIDVHNGSRLVIRGNSVSDGPQSSSAFDNVRIVVCGGLTQTGGGLIDITHNSFVFATAIATLFTVSTDGADIGVCRNYLQNLPCRPLSGGLYSCAETGATNVAFSTCTFTRTFTTNTTTTAPATSTAPTTTAPATSTAPTTTAPATSTAPTTTAPATSTAPTTTAPATSTAPTTTAPATNSTTTGAPADSSVVAHAFTWVSAVMCGVMLLAL
jgi:hypothetical protein